MKWSSIEVPRNTKLPTLAASVVEALCIRLAFISLVQKK